MRLLAPDVDGRSSSVGATSVTVSQVVALVQV